MKSTFQNELRVLLGYFIVSNKVKVSNFNSELSQFIERVPMHRSFTSPILIQFQQDRCFRLRIHDIKGKEPRIRILLTDVQVNRNSLDLGSRLGLWDVQDLPQMFDTPEIDYPSLSVRYSKGFRHLPVLITLFKQILWLNE